jgi:S-adenosylmethionine hydrolase
MPVAPVFLFTDFGSADVYVGQVKAVLQQAAPTAVVIDLLNDVPAFRVEAGAHLLAALAPRLPVAAVTIAVVDPGVGGARRAVAMQADGRWFVGPDNGLLSVLVARAATVRVYALEEAAASAAVSFHGRDVFAPAAAQLATGTLDLTRLAKGQSLDVSIADRDVPQVVYVDHYGNLMTGLRAGCAQEQQALAIGDRIVPHARVFSAVEPGSLFWYVNSIGLIEIAANQASARDIVGAAVGDAVHLH